MVLLALVLATVAVADPVELMVLLMEQEFMVEVAEVTPVLIVQQEVAVQVV
jgi:hypothetical protein